jgi:anti-anti-sigma regulatory factor
VTVDTAVTAAGLVITTVAAVGGDETWLRLAGEADLSDFGAVQHALAASVAAAGDVHMDLAALDFADVAITRLLAETAAELAPRRRLVLHQPSRSLRRLLQMCWPGQDGLELRTAE